MARRTWQQVKDLLVDEEFIESCITMEQTPEEALDVASYSRADKCSYPIHLNRINPETGEVAAVVVACDNNNAYICPECSQFKNKLRQSQMLGTMDRPGVDVAMLTLTAPSFSKVHRATWTAKDEYRFRNLDDAARYRKRLTVQKSRAAKSLCDCKQHHSYDEAIIGTPIGAYDYAGEVLWSANLPRLMNSTQLALQYRAKLAGIAPEDFRTYTVFERQKRGSLHGHMLIVADNSSYAFEKFVESFDTSKPFPSPSALIPADALHGLETGFSRLEEDSELLSVHPKKKRSLGAVLPSHKGKPATQWGPVFDIRVLEADDASAVLAEVEELDEVADFADEEEFSADMPQQKTFKRSSAYLSKYLTKNNAAFAPDALRDLSPEQRSHFMRFRKTAVLLYTDKLVYESIVRAKKQEIRLVFQNVQDSEDNGQRLALGLAEVHVAPMKADLESLIAAGVVRSSLGDALVKKATSHTLTVSDVRELVNDFEAVSLQRDASFFALVSVPARYLKMKLNSVANNAGYTGRLASNHNWIHSLKDLKEARKALFYAMNPDAEMVDYIWELVPELQEISYVSLMDVDRESGDYLALLNQRIEAGAGRVAAVVTIEQWLLYMDRAVTDSYAVEAKQVQQLELF